MKLHPVNLQAIASEGAFVYCYLREDKSKHANTPYYIGLACGKHRHLRPFGPHAVKVPSDPSKVRVLKSGLTTEAAIAWEKRFIAHYGRVDLGTGILRNATPGGDGNTDMSDATKSKISASKKGKSSPALRAACKRRGCVRSPMTEQEKRDARNRLAVYSTSPSVHAKRRETLLAKTYRRAGLSISFDVWVQMSKNERATLLKNTKAAAFLGVTLAHYQSLSRAKKISLTRIKKHSLGVLGTKAKPSS